MKAYIQFGWVLPTIFEQYKGITKDALDKKRKTGKLIEGIHFKKADDGRIYYHYENYDEYVAHGLRAA